MSHGETLPRIIQGGMGVNISDWRLAKTISMLGERGTVSGVMLEKVIARILQKGDSGGHIRRALSHFPFPEISETIIKKFFVDGGVPIGMPYEPIQSFSVNPSHLLISLTVCANFAAVWLAKEDNPNPISINYLEKVAMPHVYAVTGAMLAGVDFVTVGAGIPMQFPKLLEDIAEGREAKYRVPVIGENITSHLMIFDPAEFFGGTLPKMNKPGFIPIISSNLLANMLVKKLPEGSIQGFVVEEPTAGGHNAPPRKSILNARGELQSIYGEKDLVDYEALATLGIPFWIGGSYASPEKLKWALGMGAAGIQAGTIFALSEDSQMNAKLRAKIRKLGFEDELIVQTDMRISPTGFPFKVVELDGTMSDQVVYDKRWRICDQGELVSLYERSDGKIGYRCSAEPAKRFVDKGGNLADTASRGCLCNGLLSTCDLGDEIEPPIITLGDNTSFLKFLMKNADSSYSASDALKYLLS